MKFRQLILKLALLLIGLTCFFITAKAEEENEADSFYVKAIMPSNQLPDTSEYFHIQTSKDLKQILEIGIVNDSSQDKQFSIAVLDGMTTSVGEIGYDTRQEYEPSQAIKLSDSSEVSESVEVKSNSMVVVPVSLNIKIADFSGLVLGAVNVTEKKETGTNTSGVVNQFAYNVPVKIDVKTSDIQAKIGYKNIKVKEKDKKNNLVLTFNNPSATIIRDLSLSYKIKPLKSEKVLIEKTIENLEIAPTSLFTPSIDLGTSPFKAGRYIIEIHAQSEISQINEKWVDEFTITSKEAKVINEGLSVEKFETSWHIWLILIILVLIVIGVGYYIYTLKNKQVKKKSLRKNRRKNVRN